MNAAELAAADAGGGRDPDACFAVYLCECGERFMVRMRRGPNGKPEAGIAFVMSAREDTTKPSEAALAASIARIGAVR